VPVPDAAGPTPDAPPSAACDSPVSGRPALALQTVASGLDMPVLVTSPPGDPRLFIVEKTGAIRIVKDGALLPQPFLEVDSYPVFQISDERGLLGLAFHPQYASNRKLYVFYTDPNGDTVVEQYLADAADPDRAAATPPELVFFLDDFASNHNGGMMQFGPDGYLYIGLGDGGGAGDQANLAQNVDSLFGKLLRVDVSTLPATAPADNPFVGGAGDDLIWSYGWRNPWRWSFDRETGDLYVGDVGQNAWEEIDVEPAGSAGGLNYGWRIREGAHCYNSASCTTAGLVDPVYEYSHSTGACSAVGGYVYRGCKMPDYHGTYFFADYCLDWVRSFEWTAAGGAGATTDHPGLEGGGVVSFGEDADGELYLVRISGEVLKVVPGT
jgi:hypothetical protein